jgi:hypothetical protein
MGMYILLINIVSTAPAHQLKMQQLCPLGKCSYMTLGLVYLSLPAAFALAEMILGGTLVG